MSGMHALTKNMLSGQHTVVRSCHIHIKVCEKRKCFRKLLDGSVRMLFILNTQTAGSDIRLGEVGLSTNETVQTT